jgi:hypothetical protein
MPPLLPLACTLLKQGLRSTPLPLRLLHSRQLGTCTHMCRCNWSGIAQPALPNENLQELQLFDFDVNADMAVKVAMVARRLRVLHLQE